MVRYPFSRGFVALAALAGMGRVFVVLQAETAPAFFGGVDLRLYRGANVIRVFRTRAELRHLFLLLARAFERGLNDRAFLCFRIVARSLRRSRRDRLRRRR